MHRNIDAVTHSIQFMANVAWILYRRGHLYTDPDPSGAMSVATMATLVVLPGSPAFTAHATPTLGYAV